MATRGTAVCDLCLFCTLLFDLKAKGWHWICSLAVNCRHCCGPVACYLSSLYLFISIWLSSPQLPHLFCQVNTNGKHVFEYICWQLQCVCFTSCTSRYIHFDSHSRASVTKPGSHKFPSASTVTVWTGTRLTDGATCRTAFYCFVLTEKSWDKMGIYRLFEHKKKWWMKANLVLGLRFPFCSLVAVLRKYIFGLELKLRDKECL